jgi:Zn-finger domain-containing protein
MPGDALVTKASDRGQVEKAAKAEKIRHKDYVEDLTNVLKTDYGRRVLWNILSFCNVYGDLVGKTSEQTVFAVGKRDVGIKIIKDISDADPERLVEMMKEAQKRDM